MTSIAISSAQFWGRLWGAMPRDWAVVEEQQMPTYETAIEHLGIRARASACSTSAAARASSCARPPTAAPSVVGLDASERLLAIARERVPEADLHAGDMQELPFGDDGFDVVTGFSSFFFADDMTRALSEARAGDASRAARCSRRSSGAPSAARSR